MTGLRVQRDGHAGSQSVTEVEVNGLVGHRRLIEQFLRYTRCSMFNPERGRAGSGAILIDSHVPTVD
jgi:hypothetical protein